MPRIGVQLLLSRSVINRSSFSIEKNFRTLSLSLFSRRDALDKILKKSDSQKSSKIIFSSNCTNLQRNNSRRRYIYIITESRIEKKYPSVRKGNGRDIIDNFHSFLPIFVLEYHFNTRTMGQSISPLSPRVSVVNPSSCNFFLAIFGHCSSLALYIYIYPLLLFLFFLPPFTRFVLGPPLSALTRSSFAFFLFVF